MVVTSDGQKSKQSHLQSKQKLFSLNYANVAILQDHNNLMCFSLHALNKQPKSCH